VGGGRRTDHKSLVLGGRRVERERHRPRIRLARIPPTNPKKTLTNSFKIRSLPGATPPYDGLVSYTALDASATAHHAHGATYYFSRNTLAARRSPSARPASHRFSLSPSNFLLLNPPGSRACEHLDYYLDEFTFPVQPPHYRVPRKLFYFITASSASRSYRARALITLWLAVQKYQHTT